MFTLKVQNTTGDILLLTTNESDYQVIDIDGLNPPKAVINSSTIAGMDGSKFKSSKLLERNIVISIKLNGNVEQNRIKLYRYFRTKQWCKIFYKNETRDVYIEGYVENIDCDLFTNKEIMQISIICQNPYFKNLEEIINDISKVLNNFEFPFAFGDGIDTDEPIEFSTYEYEKISNVFNESEVDTGVVIEMSFTGEAKDPKIINVLSGEMFQILGTYNVGDVIIIDTNKGNKHVHLISNATTYNLFNQIVFGSTWFQLKIGNNYFSYAATRGDAFINIIYKHHNLYEGV